jgi:N-acetylglucosaminyldiphosphoundecaprenol N-acetyl-beta-D-mannosaminyltransferase
MQCFLLLNYRVNDKDSMAQNATPFPTVPLFGVPLSIVDYDAIVGRVRNHLDSREGRALTLDAANTMTMSTSCLDERMRDAMLEYDAILPDGMPLVWCMNLKGAGLRDRTYGPYVAEKVLAGLSRKTKVALIGGFPDLHRKLVEQSKQRFPMADYVLLYDAPATPIDDQYIKRCLENIDATGAELIFVCLGVPRQYYWVAEAKPFLGAKVCLSVGGAFDLVVGSVPYAPAWMQKAGLTWLFRLVKEPGRMWKRYFTYNTLFLWYLLTREIFTGKLFSERRND